MGRLEEPFRLPKAAPAERMEKQRGEMAKRTSKTIHSVLFSSSFGAKKLISFVATTFLALVFIQSPGGGNVCP